MPIVLKTGMPETGILQNCRYTNINVYRGLRWHPGRYRGFPVLITVCNPNGRIGGEGVIMYTYLTLTHIFCIRNIFLRNKYLSYELFRNQVTFLVHS